MRENQFEPLQSLAISFSEQYAATYDRMTGLIFHSSLMSFLAKLLTHSKFKYLPLPDAHHFEHAVLEYVVSLHYSVKLWTLISISD